MVQLYVKSGEKMTASARWRCAESGVEATKENSTELDTTCPLGDKQANLRGKMTPR